MWRLLKYNLKFGKRKESLKAWHSLLPRNAEPSGRLTAVSPLPSFEQMATLGSCYVITCPTSILFHLSVIIRHSGHFIKDLRIQPRTRHTTLFHLTAALWYGAAVPLLSLLQGTANEDLTKVTQGSLGLLHASALALPLPPAAPLPIYCCRPVVSRPGVPWEGGKPKQAALRR